MSTQTPTSPNRVAPLERLATLFDGRSFNVLRPPGMDGDEAGVTAGVGTINGRRAIAYAQDTSRMGGAVGAAEAEVIVHALTVAREQRTPVVSFLASSGARLQEGSGALGAFGRIFRANVAMRGRAPQISVITGPSAGGGCYSPALTDFVVMTKAATMFLTGPKIVAEAVGEQISAEALGGPKVHAGTGVAQFVADDDADAVRIARELVGHVGGGTAERRRFAPATAVDPSRHVPETHRQVYDVRDVARDLLDDGRFLEFGARWARNLVVGFGSIDGRSVGIVANQPRYLGGVLDVSTSEKGSRFVDLCERYRVPLVVLVDTPGFMPGSGQEWTGVIRHGAELVRAFAAATVPRFTVVLRKAFGGAYITMNCKDLGADLSLAWEGAHVGIMGADAAVKLLHRRSLAAAGDPEALQAQLAEAYEERSIDARNAVELGVVDEIIAPADTRRRLAEALQETADLADLRLAVG